MSEAEDSDSDDEPAFYMVLSESSYKTLTKLAEKLNNTPSHTQSYELAKAALQIIVENLEQEDIYTLLLFLAADSEEPEMWELYNLPDWYFTEGVQEELTAKEPAPWTAQLLEKLSTETFSSPEVLPRCVEMAMQAGAMSDADSVMTIVETFFEKYVYGDPQSQYYVEKGKKPSNT